MFFFVLSALLTVFLLVDSAITRSSRRSGRWGLWEDWNFYVYGPVFVLLCLTMAADLWWWQTDWSASARYPVMFGMPVIAVFMGHRWYRYFGSRLRALLGGQRGADGSGK